MSSKFENGKEERDRRGRDVPFLLLPLSSKRRGRTPEAHSYRVLAFLRRVSSREAGRVQPGTKGDTGEWPA